MTRKKGGELIFNEELIIMGQTTQSTPEGPVADWQECESITGKLQINNMPKSEIAQAHGVTPTGHLVLDAETAKKITLNTYLRYPKGGGYVRVADEGIVEAGPGFFKERQFAVETVRNLPR